MKCLSSIHLPGDPLRQITRQPSGVTGAFGSCSSERRVGPRLRPAAPAGSGHPDLQPLPQTVLGAHGQKLGAPVAKAGGFVTTACERVWGEESAQ